MKNIIFTFLLVFLPFVMLAQQKENKPNVENKKVIILSNKVDTMQYALGAYLGQWMVKNNFEVQNASIFLTGMNDVLQKKPLMVNDSIISPLIIAYQQTSQNEKNKLLEEQLFSSLKGKGGVGILPNGVHYIIRRQGEGARPTAKSTVVINAVGVLPDGTIFEDTYKKKQPITTPINTLIPGLKDIIQYMPVGSVWRVFIPSELGYGATGLKNMVPPYSALVYDIELLEIKE